MIRNLLLLSLSCLIGGGACFYLYRLEYQRSETGGLPVQVVSARMDIPMGRSVRSEWLTTKWIPSSYVEERHIPAEQLRDLIGMPLTRTVKQGEAVLRTDLSSMSSSARTLSTIVPPGMRAVTIRGPRQIRPLSGLLRPGDRIDLIFTYGQEQDRHQTILLQNMLVLAFGSILEASSTEELTATEAQRRYRSRRLNEASTMTLQVTLEQAAVVATAERAGSFIPILRNPNDTEIAIIRPLEPMDLLDPARRDRFSHRAFELQSPTSADTERAVHN